MSGILQGLLASISSAAAAVTDTYFNLVTLLLNTTSTNGAQNNTFLDSSTNNFTITRNGNTTQGTFTPFSQTGWGNYFDGVGDGFSYSGTTFGSGAWTVELWFYFTGTSFTGPIHLFEGTTNSLVLAIMSTTSIRVDQVNVSNDSYTVPTMSANTWYHLTATKDSSGNQTIFLNGTRSSTGVTTTSRNFSTATLRIAYSTIGGTDFTGYYSNLRFVTGTAVYNPLSSTITVPTSPLTAISGTQLLTCQNNRFLDNSSNAFALTVAGTPSVQAFSPFAPTAAYSTSVVGGSGYFTTSDYLTFSSNAAFSFGTGDFTVELWYYPLAINLTNNNFIDTRNAGGNTTGFFVKVGDGGSGAPTTVTATVGATNITQSGLVGNAWNHIAITRASNTSRVYVNGVSGTSASISTNLTDNGLIVNRFVDGGVGINGYTSSLRIVKGTAVYTGTTLTIPTTQLTAISGTSVLLNYTNSGIYDSAAKNDLQTVGNAQVSTTQAKWGTTSMYFDGTGDYLQIPDSNLFISGTENFTVEMWVYLSATGTMYIAGQCDSSGTLSSQSIVILKTSTEKLQSYAVSGSTQYTCTSTANISQNTWTYIAFVRNGSTLTQYINGSADGTATISTASVNNSSNKFGVGSLGEYTVNTTNGYIDDFRITKGFARTITASPTAAFPLQ